jgi:hypothetical protein
VIDGVLESTEQAAIEGGAARERAVEDELRRTVRMRGREQGGEWPALRHAEQHRLTRPRGVHHRLDVLHPLIESGRVGRGIREPGTALVEEDDAGERGQVLDE